MNEFLTFIIPFFSLIAACASAFAVYQANVIAASARDIHINSVIRSREIELLSLALEKLNIYDVWCRSGGTGEGINFNDSKITEYDSRDDAYFDIPRDVKVLSVQVSSHSKNLEGILASWEKGFINKIGDSYSFDETKLSSKIEELRNIMAAGFKS